MPSDDFRHMVRREIDRFNRPRDRHRGDDFFVVFASPSAAIRTAADRVRSLGIELRSGIHLGEIEQRRTMSQYRIQGLATPGQILVSGTVADAVVGSAVSLP